MFGGSFNPPHLGHLKLVEKVVNDLSLDRVIIMPTYSTPLKDNSEFADAELRLEMCRLNFENTEKAEVSDLEIKREGKSFTYLTLNSLKESYPDDELFLIVGADMYMTLQNWKNPDEIFKLAKIIVVPRNGGDYDLISQKKLLSERGCVSYLLDKPVYDVSSTEIRNKLRSGDEVGSLIAPKVLEFIKNECLYGI